MIIIVVVAGLTPKIFVYIRGRKVLAIVVTIPRSSAMLVDNNEDGLGGSQTYSGQKDELDSPRSSCSTTEDRMQPDQPSAFDVLQPSVRTERNAPLPPLKLSNALQVSVECGVRYNYCVTILFRV